MAGELAYFLLVKLSVSVVASSTGRVDVNARDPRNVGAIAVFCLIKPITLVLISPPLNRAAGSFC